MEKVKLSKIRDLCEKTFNINWKNNKEEIFEYIDLSAVSREKLLIFESSKVDINNAPSRAKQIIRTNDILFATTRPTLKRIAIVPKEYDKQICSTGFAVLRIKNNLAVFKYIFYLLQTVKFIQRMEDVQRGASYPAVSNKDIMDFKIPLPSLDKQKTIAQTLDKAKELIELRKTSIKKLDELSKSVFIDMFGDPVENPMGWTDSRLGELIHSAKDGPHESPKYSDEGIPFLSARHVRPNKMIWNDLKYIDRETAERYWKKCKPEIGDILYSKGGTTGFAVSVNTDKDFAIWVHIALLKPIHENVNYIWLERMLNTSYCYSQSQHLTKGIANKDLGLKRMVNIKMYLPPIDLQNKFAKTIQKIEIQKALYEKELVKLEENFEALLAKSFG
ncbi:MAG: Type I restriction-modification system, specificity subunit S (EC [uncultured Sulfurovum sp.]|uniref:Type I restriction-modification system, specificity subunit S (EC) n=1 Tax=uncultured Sulfurovum sp. TaxID=269237 RepID=A0A6S6SBR0_9BACT|nr:MAG: Type I restriction-modification system, specificity subunit S (EC [uncultured Sulfurovum sp.]